MNVIARLVELCDMGMSSSRIAALPNEEGTAAPQGDVWYADIVRRILERNQRPGRRYKPRTKRAPRFWDRQRSTELALACRKDGLSLRAIAKQLDAANLAPPRGGEWYAAQVAELLGAMSAPNAVDERTLAQQLRVEGRPLREIGRVLLAEGYRPSCAARWRTQAVSALLAAS